jgi:hypothetical protein
MHMPCAARLDALTGCLPVVVRSIETHVLQRFGLRRGSSAPAGVVNLVHHHGSAASLNVHLHLLGLDHACETLGERARFRRVPAPSEAQLQSVLSRLVARIARRRTKYGWRCQVTDPLFVELETRAVIDELAAASTRCRVAEGAGVGQRNPHPARACACTADHARAADIQGFWLSPSPGGPPSRAPPFSAPGSGASTCAFTPRQYLSTAAEMRVNPANPRST